MVLQNGNADAFVFILLGPPGSGKSTQGAMLASELGIPRLSTGDLLRAEVSAATELGCHVRVIMESGGIVDDAVVNAMLSKRMSERDCARGAILDGYPRTVQQAGFLQSMLEHMNMAQPIIIELNAGFDVLLSRLTNREYCPQCARTYNHDADRPRTPGTCDEDGATLIKRADDERRAIQQRLANHRRLSAMLDRHFQGRMHRIPAHGAPGEIFRNVMEIVRTETHAAIPCSAA